MKTFCTYNIVVNDIIQYTCTNIHQALKAFNEIRKSEPKAWMQTCYCQLWVTSQDIVGEQSKKARYENSSTKKKKKNTSKKTIKF